MPFGTLKMVKSYKDRKVSKWMSYNLKKGPVCLTLPFLYIHSIFPVRSADHLEADRYLRMKSKIIDNR